jgi:Tol biopolymer transport system component
MLRTTHTSLGKLDRGAVSLVVSPDHRHAAQVVERSGKFFVVRDGVPEKPYDWIDKDTPRFSPDSRRMAYAAKLQAEDGGPHPVVDGVEIKTYVAAGMYLTFSPDGKRLAYAASQGLQGPQFVVVDDVAGKEYDGIGSDSLRFSPDGQHFAYGARRGNTWRAVIDGQEQKAYGGLGAPLIFSPDGRRWAYVAKQQRGIGPMRRSMDCVVVDGIESEFYDGTLEGTPLFSPDSKRVAYAASRDNSMFAVVDGAAAKGFTSVECLTFSPDSRKFAYVACGPVPGFKGLRSNEAFRTVVNGVEEKHYIDISLAGIRFSPDSQRTAYVMQNFEGWWAVVDGEELGPYEGIGKGSPLFSPDSRHHAYAAGRLGTRKMVVVHDRAEGREYDGILGPSFSPDSRRLAYAGRRGERWRIVVDRAETQEEYDGFDSDTAFIWDSEKKLHTVAIRDGEILCVEVEVIQE